MNEEQIQEFWLMFKEYLDKKHVEAAAERYVDMLADYGISDEAFQECFGADSNLDEAIRYYLDIDEIDTLDEEEDEWDE